MRQFLLVLAVLVFSANFATAHEFFVKPTPQGDSIKLELLSTHYLMVGEELEPADLNDISIFQNGQTSTLSFTANEKSLAYETLIKNSDSAVIIGHRKPLLYSNTTRGSQEGSRKELAAKGFTVLKTTLYEKFTKTYINPSKSDSEFAKPIGHLLEFVPVTNPADFANGKALTFKVLYDGEPVKINVNATYDGYNSTDMTAYAVKTSSGYDGLVTITPSASGTWMVQGNLAATKSPFTEGDYDEMSLSATVVFSVK
jgi:uncharacterized GH25 family protein